MPQVCLDGVANVTADSAHHPNEIGTLTTLRHGLTFLADSVRWCESRYAEMAKTTVFAQIGGSEQERAEQVMVACHFHWFGTSVCNYARLVGFIRGLEQNLFSRGDLTDAKKFDGISKTINTYVGSIPELAPVVLWRHKVAGHFAITDPRKDDNIATLKMSVMHPVSLENGIYFVGAFQLTQSNAAGIHTSAIPMWSVTKVFGVLRPRFWPA